jgi:cbb3-type cytochrome oxidase subunit 3
LAVLLLLVIIVGSIFVYNKNKQKEGENETIGIITETGNDDSVSFRNDSDVFI